MVRNLSGLHIIYELPARQTISDLLENLGQTYSEYQDYAFRNLDFKTIETDEIWSFVGSKQKNVPGGKDDHPDYGDVWA